MQQVSLGVLRQKETKFSFPLIGKHFWQKISIIWQIFYVSHHFSKVWIPEVQIRQDNFKCS